MFTLGGSSTWCFCATKTLLIPVHVFIFIQIVANLDTVACMTPALDALRTVVRATPRGRGGCFVVDAAIPGAYVVRTVYWVLTGVVVWWCGSVVVLRVV